MKNYYDYIGIIKINVLLFKMAMLNNSLKVPRGVKQGSRRKYATQFCAVSKIIYNKREMF